MPLRHLREEIEILHEHLKRNEPDLGFIILHMESAMQYVGMLAHGKVFPDTDKEEQAIIQRYQETTFGQTMPPQGPGQDDPPR